MLVLEVVEGPDLGGVFPLPPEEPQLIGRSSEALPLCDLTISRRHAELTPDNGRWFIRDLASANGTFLNGRLITDRKALRIGDEVGCGATLFRFVEHDATISPIDPNDYSFDTSADSIVVNSPHSLDAARNQLRMVHRLTTATAGTIDPITILRLFVAILVDEFKPDRCIGILFDDTKKILHSIVGCSNEIKDNPADYSLAIINHACQELTAVRIQQVDKDVRFKQDEGVIASRLRSSLCAPLIAHGRMLGAVLLEINTENRQWTEEDAELLTTANGHVGLAMLTADLVKTRLQHERLAATGETVASISHSVKNMLQGLRSGAGAIDLALSKGDLELAREGWPILARNLDRVYALTFNMLAWSRTTVPEISFVQTEPIIHDAIELIQGACQRRKIKLLSEIESDMPPIPVDATAMLQVLLNVLHNAVDAAPSKSGIVELHVSITDDSCATFYIRDNGCGIEEGQQDLIFNAFHTTKGQRGTGLGLAVAQKFVQSHGGTITLSPAPEQGTICEIKIPLERSNDPADTHGPLPIEPSSL